MKKIRLLFALALTAFIISCDKDDVVDVFERPVVNVSSEAVSVPVGSTGQEVEFEVSYDENLSVTYSATGSGITVINNSGTVTGNSIRISFDAGSEPGAASITLTLTDSEGQTATATQVLNIGASVNQVRVTSNITEDTTWTSDKVYILGGRITVVEGATLTIEAGTIIKGEAGTGSNATALLVARGGKLMAEGTADAPVIFTSVADEIMPDDVAAGNFGSPNLDPDIDGLWGGVLILGRAPISASNESGDVAEVQIEGIPTSDQNGLYGGDLPDDNSGVLKYISIRHGGTNIGSGNEINGLTLGGVGSGTVIENIEVISNQDDGIEWFGGTVDVRNVVIWNVNDDAIDTDQSWAGTLDNFVIIAPGDHNFELDGPEGNYIDGHTIRNGTVIANDPEFGRFSTDLINTDDNSIVTLQNIYFTSIADGQQINRVEFQEGSVTFEGIQLDVEESRLSEYVNGEVPQGVTAVSTPTVGADVSVFGWTWAGQYGKLAGL